MSSLLADAQAALAVLSAREEIDPAKVLLLGHGEGAMLLGELPPFLLLHGDLDVEVPPNNATGLKTFLNEAGHMRVSCTVAKNMNHYLQTAETGAIEEYPDLPPACAKGIVKRITSFVGFCTR